MTDCLQKHWFHLKTTWEMTTNTASLTAAVPNAANPAAILPVATHPWMTALDRKYMIFMVSLQEDNKDKFAFTWEGVQSRLPWEFPMIAHAVLAELVEL